MNTAPPATADDATASDTAADTAAVPAPSARISALIADQAAHWDRDGRIPIGVLRAAGAEGLLCAQVAAEHGGPGLSSLANGELTAHAGTLCGSFRSIMTSQGMAAWMIQRFAGPRRAELLAALCSGTLAAVAMSEPDAGSDLAAVATTVRNGPDGLVLNGVKTWVTGAAYADLLIVYCRLNTGTAQDDDADSGAGAGAGPSRGTDALLAVPADTPGVRIRPVPDPLGCRAGGHADLDLVDVRLPASALLGTARMPGALVTSALTYGRLSVAWGCVGILRSCLAEAAAHARGRRQFGRRIADFQLVAAHLAELLVAEQAATRVCEYASGRWDGDAPDVVAQAVLAKHLAAESAAAGARRAVQVLASAGARDSHPVARAYRDAKLMEIIEGTGEISRLLLAEQALARWSRPRPEGAR